MKKIFAVSALMALCASVYCQPMLVAHRGCRNVEGVDENTTASLEYAQKVPVDYVEFDVHLTSDDKVIVFHGPAVPGLGKDIRNITFDEARAVVLPYGGQMPTLEEWFRQVKKNPRVKVILEFKTDFTPERERLEVQLAISEIRRLKMEKYVSYTTFSKVVVEEILRIDPSAKILFLMSGKEVLSADEVKALGCLGISYDVTAWMSNPSIIQRSREIGLETTLWLANDDDLIDWADSHGIDCISVDDPARAKPHLDQLRRL